MLFFLSIFGNLWLLQAKNIQGYIHIISFLLNSTIALLLFLAINRFVDFKTYSLVNKDSISGLYNEKAFIGLLSTEIKRLQRTKHPLCVIFFDIDSYKRTSDRYGQQEADSIVQKFSSIISSTIRESDTAGRLNLDIFAILAIGSNETTIVKLLDRFSKQIKQAEFGSNLGRLCTAVVQVDEADSAQSILDKGFEMIFEDKSQNMISMLKIPQMKENDED